MSTELRLDPSIRVQHKTFGHFILPLPDDGTAAATTIRFDIPRKYVQIGDDMNDRKTPIRLSRQLLLNYVAWSQFVTCRVQLQSRGKGEGTQIHIVYADDDVTGADVTKAIADSHAPDGIRHVVILVRGFLQKDAKENFVYKTPGENADTVVEVPYFMPTNNVSELCVSWLTYAISYMLASNETDGDVFLKYAIKLVNSKDSSNDVLSHPSFAPLLTICMRNTEPQ
jgi:hypothetical protein